jgi:CRISPR-associated protein Cas6
MYWEENAADRPFVVSRDVVDLVFDIACRCLPLDHAFALSQALQDALPWLREEEDAGIHLIHGAESGNGWYRPVNPEKELLQLSKRTKMMLRLPGGRIEDARELSGASLEIAGYPLQVGRATVRPLSPMTTLFSRYVVATPGEDEEQFMTQTYRQLEGTGLAVRKMLCGKTHVLKTPTQEIFTRSLMVADLSVQDAVKLQQKGLGPGRKLGCGLFVPHKGIGAVKQPDLD